MVFTQRSDDEVKEKVIDMLEYLPLLLILLACPLMMIFMMGGMHGSHGSSQHNASAPPSSGQGVDRATEVRVAELERQVQTLRNELAQRVENS